jgi:hypothetical protein
VTLATCQSLADLDVEDKPLIAALEDRGFDARPAVWDNPSVTWGTAGLVVLRSTRDYARRRARFLRWTRSLPRLLNPAAVVEWNTDKHYLEDLRARGVPVLKTMWLEPDEGLSKRHLHTRFPASDEFVIKPAISGVGQDSGRYTANVAESRRLAIEHADRLLREGRSVMVQRYQPSVDTLGERSLVFIDGKFEYAVHKAAVLHGPSQGPEEEHIERINAVVANDAELAVAGAVHEAVHAVMAERLQPDQPLLYARIDLVSDDDGRPTVMEVGLTDSSLHFSQHPGALDTFADAIARRAWTD